MGAKRAKKDDWKKQRKVGHLSQIKNKFYIFCEGIQTEPNYFIGFKRYIEQNSIYKNLVLLEVEGVGADTERVIAYAERYVSNNKIRNAQIWCVYDKDSFPPEHFNRVSEHARDLNVLNKDKNIVYNVAWSNQCIEYWFVLHFNYYDSDNERPYYIKNINQNFKNKGLSDYDKSKDKVLFEKLTWQGDPKLAIRYAKQRDDECCGISDADSSPATKVYVLVEELAKYLPDEIKERYL